MSSPENPAYEVSEERIALQQEFLGFVNGIRKPVIGVVPALVEGVDHQGRISTIDSPFSDGHRPQLLISSPVYTDLKEVGSGKMPDRVSFNYRSMLGIGKGNSRRKVSFGVANLNWFDHQGVAEHIPLAVKPFDWSTGQRTMLHEAAFFEYCEQKDIRAPKVFGIARYGDRGALLTYFEPDLTTLDNIDWLNLAPEDQGYHLHTAVETLATLHENGIFHGDAEFKNIAFSQQRGSTFAVDLEFTVSVDQISSRTILLAQMAKKMSNDLRSVRKSMLENHLLNGTELQQFEQFHLKVLIPYIERIQKGSSHYTGALKSAYERVVQAFAAEAYGEEFSHILDGIGSFAIK